MGQEREERGTQLRASTGSFLETVWLPLWLAGSWVERRIGWSPLRANTARVEVTSALLVSSHTTIIILDRQWGCLQFVDCDLREETIHEKHVNILHTHRFSTSPCRGLRVRPALVVGRPLPTRQPLPEI
jgi:hypothetical protein